MPLAWLIATFKTFCLVYLLLLQRRNPLSKDGAVAVYINSQEHAANTEMMTVSQRLMEDGILICGGANTNYNVSDACHWFYPWSVGSHWTPGPRMSEPRYQAALVSRPGLVWILGL